MDQDNGQAHDMTDIPSEEKLAEMKAGADRAERDYAAESFGIDGAASWIPTLAPWLLRCIRHVRDLKRALGAKSEEASTLRARAERAEKRLAAVLALTDEDIEEAMCGVGVMSGNMAVLELIRSRATEGAEEPTGGTT